MLTNKEYCLLVEAREYNKRVITTFKGMAGRDLSVMVLVTSAVQTVNAIDALIYEKGIEELPEAQPPAEPAPPYPELTDVVMPPERRQPVPGYPRK